MFFRMWLYVRDNISTPPQQLGLRSRVPDKVEIPIPYYMGRRRRYYGPAFVQTIMSYEGLKKTMEKLNNELKSEPVGGILVYELVTTIIVPWQYEFFKKNEQIFDLCIFQMDFVKNILTNKQIKQRCFI